MMMSVGISALVKELHSELGLSRKDSNGNIEKEIAGLQCSEAGQEMALCFLCQGPQGI